MNMCLKNSPFGGKVIIHKMSFKCDNLPKWFSVLFSLEIFLQWSSLLAFPFRGLHIMKLGACARIITILWSLWSFPFVLSSPVSSAREVLLSLLCHNQWICTHFKWTGTTPGWAFLIFPGLLSLPLKVLIMRANLHSTIFWSLCYFQGSILEVKKKVKNILAFWKLRVGNEEGTVKIFMSNLDT